MKDPKLEKLREEISRETSDIIKGLDQNKLMYLMGWMDGSRGKALEDKKQPA